MIYAATALIFFTSAITLYALIQVKKNIILMMILIPALLTSSVFSGYSIYVLQGTPITRGLPVDVKVEIVWAELAKPDIRLLMRVGDNESPLYYVIAYTKDNVEALKKAMKNQEQGKDQPGTQGTFKKKNGGEEAGGEYMFMNPPGANTVRKDPSVNERPEIDRPGNQVNNDALEMQGVDRAIQQRMNENTQHLDLDGAI